MSEVYDDDDSNGNDDDDAGDDDDAIDDDDIADDDLHIQRPPPSPFC